MNDFIRTLESAGYYGLSVYRPHAGGAGYIAIAHPGRAATSLKADGPTPEEALNALAQLLPEPTRPAA